MLAQEYTGSIALLTVLVMERIENPHDRVAPNRIAPRKRTGRVVRAELHRRIDVVRTSDAFHHSERRFVDHHRKHASGHETNAILDDLDGTIGDLAEERRDIP